MIARTGARSGLPLVALAGNPNTGKTTLYNQLTGARAKVGNYPGVTVERHEAELELAGAGRVRLMDVPGTYSLSARSREEQLAVTAIAGLHPLERPDCIVVVVDATQLARNLYLVLQVIELDQPVVVALNMIDALPLGGRELALPALEGALGVPVVPIAAVAGTGLGELQRAVARVLSEPSLGRPGARWTPGAAPLLADVAAAAGVLPRDWVSDGTDPVRTERRERALALWSLLSLEADDELAGVPTQLRSTVAERRRLADKSGRSIEQEIISGRYEWIDARAPGFFHGAPSAPARMTDRIDRVLLHPVVGFALFLLFMTAVFQSLFSWADPAISIIERGFGALSSAARATLPAGIASELFIEGGIGGIGSVLVFLPQILLLFFFIGLMEDTGYMARVAFLMDRLMKSIGLHGRAFVPMLSGYACAVPAILATRTMERRRDRLLTMLVVPLMTCSARLPVYGLLIAALQPPDRDAPFAQGLLLVAMYFLSAGLAIAVAWVLGRTVVRGRQVPLILEMPPYRMPHWRSVLRMMWERSTIFLREAGTVILACTVAMWALLSFPRDAEQEGRAAAQRAPHEVVLASPASSADERAAAERELASIDASATAERLQQSFGGRAGRAIEPALEPLGFDWKIGVGLLGAFAAREVFVSTMSLVYGLGDAGEESQALRQRLQEERRADGRRLFTPLTCFSLMVFFAIACQCSSTLAVVKRETASWRWPVFLFAYTGVLAWLASFAVYQGGRLLGFS